MEYIVKNEITRDEAIEALKKFFDYKKRLLGYVDDEMYNIIEKKEPKDIVIYVYKNLGTMTCVHFNTYEKIKVLKEINCYSKHLRKKYNIQFQ